jgi:hypothetical protein
MMIRRPTLPEDKNVKPKTFSLRRRHLMLAGIAGAAAPAVALAASETPVAPRPFAVSVARGDTLLVSGRVVDASGKPLPGSRVELLQHGIAGAADGDGRFVLSAKTAHASRGVLCRVSHGGRSHVTYLAFARRHRAQAPGNAVLERDEGGTWRTTCGLSIV